MIDLPLMWLIYALCDVLGLTTDEFCVWLCILLGVQGLGVLAWGLYEIRRPTVDPSDRYFGGV